MYIHTSLSLSLYIYIYVCIYICVYIYIYIERERERASGWPQRAQNIMRAQRGRCACFTRATA